jgi:hypothetical protein
MAEMEMGITTWSIAHRIRQNRPLRFLGATP